jgi:hypothetical protein
MVNVVGLGGRSVAEVLRMTALSMPESGKLVFGIAYVLVFCYSKKT